jgi:PAS domain S-box-containing protein
VEAPSAPTGTEGSAPRNDGMTETPRVARVLVADDTATVRLLLRRTLEMSHLFEVVGEAADGGQAVELAAALQPDMVLLDLSMPVLDGMDAIPRIRRDAPGARIVVLSAFGPDGKGARAVEAGATAYLEKNQRPGQLVATLHDIWTSSQPEECPDPEVCRQAWDHAPVAMALVGPGDRVLHANGAWHRLTGRSGDDAGAVTMADLVHPEDRPAVAGSSSSSVEARLVRPDGRTVWAAINTAPAEGALIVTMMDITEQKRAVRELARSNAELSSFAYLAAHELKSPLQAISGFAALLDKMHAPLLDEHGREFVSWILDGSTRMNSLIEDLLAYCAVDRAEAVMGPVSLEGALADALNQLKAEVTGRRAIVEVGPLPVVTGDAVQLVQLLQNLLTNALKFVDSGRVPRILVSAERTGQAWTVTVADNGIGVADGARDRIFGMFERLHPRDRYSGTGIGLSICKRIVERRGGVIWVEANPGGGSRFRFTLPDVLSLPGEAPAA